MTISHSTIAFALRFGIQTQKSVPSMLIDSMILILCERRLLLHIRKPRQSVGIVDLTLLLWCDR